MFPINYEEVTRYRGFAAVSLKLSQMAIPALRERLDSFGTTATKRRAFTLSKLAGARPDG